MQKFQKFRFFEKINDSEHFGEKPVLSKKTKKNNQKNNNNNNNNKKKKIYIYICVYICCDRGKKETQYFHPYKPVF